MSINIMRLAMMARSEEDYFFYHDELGADIVNALILLVSLGMALLCIFLEKGKHRESSHAN